MAHKFGASKFRNAVPSVPARETWYRSSLTSASPNNTVVYSSVIQTNTEHVVTLTPAGDVSVRAYNAVGEKEKDVWAGKLGGVVDWDLSRLEDRGMYVAGVDGTVTYYAVGDGAPTKRVAFTPAAKVSGIYAHPTTAGLALATSTSPVVAVYDMGSPSAPALTLSSPNDVPLWSASWSGDGRLVAGVSKKGAAYIWDARAGSDPQLTRDVSTMLQALKPVHVKFVGGDVFVTSFSRMRARQYSLLSAANGLSTSFTASVDNSQGPLVPVVDEDRRIVFAAGKGDMTLRQIELSGPQGYQEATHPLPAPLTSGSVALAHWSTLPVMEAQIETVLLPTTDKDGDAILPLAIKVPRRQLVDYHGDLYPDPIGTVPEQTAAQWLAGGDNVPLRVSVDPSRRGTWEKSVKEGRDKFGADETAADAPAPAVTTPAAPSAPAPAAPTPAAAPAATSPPIAAPVASRSPPPAAPQTVTPPTSSDLLSTPTPSRLITTPPPTADLPALQDDETYSSTSYKVRNIGAHILAYQKAHVSGGAKGPLMVGLQGPQGCGKTTLCEALLAWLQSQGLRPGVLSLDDLYLPHAGLKKVAADHPNNPLLAGRGPPGTHDIDLAIKTLEAVKEINNGGGHVDLPIFDKSLCGGEGDRSPNSVSLDGPVDVFILEGWSFGFGFITPAELEKRYAAKDGKYFPQHSLQSLQELNAYLGDFAAKVYPFFSAFVTVEPVSYEYVFRWRLQQEHAMKAANGGKGMTDEQVHKFVERYMPAYELWSGGILEPSAPWAGRLVRMKFGEEREVLAIETPEKGIVEPKAAPAASTAAPKETAPATVPAASAAPATGAAAAPPVATVTPPTPAKAAAAPAQTTPTPSAPATPAPAAATATGERYNPGWSRKYIGGKTPLIPTYDQIPTVVTLHQDSVVLKISPDLAVFPIDGPGGRVCVHPLNKRGRLPVGGVGYLSGGVGLADFAVDLFSDHVVLAGEDGVVRIWNVGKDGIEGPGPEPAMVIRGNKVDKVAQIAFHPTAKDTLVVATNDHGTASLRFYDLAEGKEAKQVELPFKGITGFAFSSNGDRVALATKDSKVAVLDPRDPSTLVSNKAHDSVRSFQLAWVDEAHVLSLGFGRGSMRQLNLYSVDKEISTIASQTIDVSPGVLFPVYDPDTNILQVWGKGERTISAYEIQPEKSEKIAKLPAFTGSSPQLAVAFLPKTSVDVKKVEVARALRLTARSIEEVFWTIPRNRPQFFQDDIYVPTIAPRAVTTAAEWLAGKDTPPERISLRPDGMEPLSAAPASTQVQRPKFVPAANVMTEEERKKKEMDDLFQRAKIIDSSDDEDDEPKRGGLPPPDDDW